MLIKRKFRFFLRIYLNRIYFLLFLLISLNKSIFTDTNLYLLAWLGWCGRCWYWQRPRWSMQRHQNHRKILLVSLRSVLRNWRLPPIAPGSSPSLPLKVQWMWVNIAIYNLMCVFEQLNMMNIEICKLTNNFTLFIWRKSTSKLKKEYISPFAFKIMNVPWFDKIFFLAKLMTNVTN